MSIQGTTTHFHFPLVVGTDRPIFSDYNAAMETLDEQLYNATSQLSVIPDEITALQDAARTAAEKIAALETFQTEQTGVNALVNNSILALQQATATIVTKFDSAGIADPYDAEHGIYSVGAVVTHNGQRYECITAVTASEPFDADKWRAVDVQSVLHTIASSLSTAAANASFARSHVEALDTDVYSAGTALISADIAAAQSLTPSQAFTNFNTIKVRIGSYYGAQDRNMYMQAFDIDLRHLVGSEDEFIYSWYLSPTNFMSVVFGINLTTGELVINDIQLGTDTAQNFGVYVEAFGYKQAL